MSEQPALLDGAVPARQLNFDEESGILYLLPDETNICPYCHATDQQSWQCGEPEFYEMSCQICGEGYGVSHLEVQP